MCPLTYVCPQLTDSPMISRMVTGCDSVAGALRPATFTATTLKLIFSPTGRPRTTNPCLSQSSLFAVTHSVSKIKRELHAVNHKERDLKCTCVFVLLLQRFIVHVCIML